MRILYSHRIQSRDGQSVHVEELVGALRAVGHEVLVVGPGFYEASSFGGESSTVARLRRLLPGAAGEFAELAYNVPAYRRLRRAYNTFKPDLIYERYNLFFLAGTWLARQTGVPLFLEVNSPLADERTRFGGLRLIRLAHRLECRVWRSATRVLAVTGVLRDIIVAAGAKPDRVSVVPNGVVLSRFPRRVDQLDAPADAPGGPITLGFVGFVRDWHGLDAVLDAIARAHMGHRIRLMIVGDGPARPALEQQAARLGLSDRVQFTGLVEHERIPELVVQFDIALQPKVVPYASPLKVFDYMAAGCAIVAPNQPNIREILTHEDNALLFDVTEEDGLWTAVISLCTDAARRRRLGIAARLTLEARQYTWLGNANQITDWARSQPN